MNLGWKTITGTILLAVGQALETQPPPIHMVGETMSFLGTLLAGYGIAHKQAKILAEVTSK